MNVAADPILEFLDEHEIAVPKGVFDNELGASASSIARALDDLEARGLIERDDNFSSYYRLTDKGRAYLSGELDASELEADSGNEG
ncbi:phenylalanine--tRNA ligase subunit alpha [Natrinema ejinorense]|nr:helix-turn-helix transcriptional regulator [Natrinema ejinorense]